jgi:hypothetical protein
MRKHPLAPVILAAIFLGAALVASPPPGPKPTVGVAPPKVEGGATRQPVPLLAFSVAGALKQDPSVPNTSNWIETYSGVITLTANVELFDVDFNAASWTDGAQPSQLLGKCDVRAKCGPVILGAKTNFKRGDARLYNMSCSSPTGGPKPSYVGPSHATLNAFYFLTNPPATQEKSVSSYRIEMVK